MRKNWFYSRSFNMGGRLLREYCFSNYRLIKISSPLAKSEFLFKYYCSNYLTNIPPNFTGTQQSNFRDYNFPKTW